MGGWLSVVSGKTLIWNVVPKSTPSENKDKTKNCDKVIVWGEMERTLSDNKQKHSTILANPYPWPSGLGHVGFYEITSLHYENMKRTEG